MLSRPAWARGLKPKLKFNCALIIFVLKGNLVNFACNFQRL